MEWFNLDENTHLYLYLVQLRRCELHHALAITIQDRALTWIRRYEKSPSSSAARCCYAIQRYQKGSP